MNKINRLICLALASVILFSSCSSTTMIVSDPPKAKLFIDGELVGETPYRHTDSKIVGSTMTLKMEKEGYQPFITNITKNEEPDIGAIIGGCLVYIPFLWTLKYKPVHTYMLEPASADMYESEGAVMTQPKTKVDKLRELKQLLDDKIITQEEFEKEKTKILDSKE